MLINQSSFRFQLELLSQHRLCLKRQVRLSFRPGFSPVPPDKERAPNRFNGFLFFSACGASLSKNELRDSSLIETVETGLI